MKNNDDKDDKFNENEKSDIIELTDAFLSVMDDLQKDRDDAENERKKNVSHIKHLIPDLISEIQEDTDSEMLDEESLAAKFENGTFEDDGAKQADDNEDLLLELSENREERIFIASLFLSGKPIEIATFRKMLNPLNIENRLLTYAEHFNKLKIGVKIRMVSGGYQIVTDSDVTTYLEKYFGERTESLSRASLETVAIIAYRQPVTKAEVEEMREVNSSGTMRYLLDKNLIKVAGRKQVPGKPLLYATTKYFLEYFGLNNLSELPTFREWQELKQNQ